MKQSHLDIILSLGIMCVLPLLSPWALIDGTGVFWVPFFPTVSIVAQCTIRIFYDYVLFFDDLYSFCALPIALQT